jgi:hypothetical protein
MRASISNLQKNAQMSMLELNVIELENRFELAGHTAIDGVEVSC